VRKNGDHIVQMDATQRIAGEKYTDIHDFARKMYTFASDYASSALAMQ